MPTVTVLMPAFNAERYLREAMASVLIQDFTDLELLIVNDGSTDGTRDIVREFQDPRVRTLDNRVNLGLTPSLNLALREARGTYVARQDSDDVSEPGRIGRQVAFLEQRPEVALVGTWFSAIDQNGVVLRRTTLPVEDIDVRWALFFFCPLVHSAVMWRRLPVHDQVGGYDETLAYAQDHQLWARIADRFAVANLPDFLVRYREHPQSMTETYGERTLEGDELQLAAVSAALGWHTLNREQRQARYRAMSALLRVSRTTPLHPDAARIAAADVLALQTHLGGQPRITAAAAGRHRRAVRAAVGRGLVRIAALHAGAGRRSEARQLTATACRAYWPIIGSRNAVRLWPRLVGSGRVGPGADA